MLSDKNGFFSDETGTYRLIVSKKLDYIFEKKISNLILKQIIKIELKSKSDDTISGVLIGFSQPGQIVALKYQLERKARLSSNEPKLVNGEHFNEHFSELKMITFDSKNIFSRNKINHVKKGLGSDSLFVQTESNCYFLKIDEQSFIDNPFRKAIVGVFNKDNIKEFKIESGYNEFLPIYDRFIFSCNSSGDYLIINVESGHKISGKFSIPENKEYISLVEFSKGLEYLIMVTAKEDSLDKIIIYKVNFGGNKLLPPTFSILHQRSFSYFGNELTDDLKYWIFKHISCEAKVNGKYLLVCYKRNYPFSKIVLTLCDERISSLQGMASHIGKWKNAIYVKKNDTFGTVLGSQCGEEGSGKRDKGQKDVKDSGDRIWILGGNFLSVVGFEEEVESRSPNAMIEE